MKISAKCNYALGAVIELAHHWPKKEPVQIQAIAKNQNVPARYLVQILIQLKNLGLVESMRGKDGGYVLAKAPSQITLNQIVREIDGPAFRHQKIKGAAHAKRNTVLKVIWGEVDSAMLQVMERVTIAEICDKLSISDRAISYSI